MKYRGQNPEVNCYVEILRSEDGYITRLLFQSSQPLGLLSVLVRRGRCGEKNKCTNKLMKKLSVNKEMLIQVTSNEQVYAYFCN
jgi:hypothetical protein